MISARFPRTRTAPGYRPDFGAVPRTWNPPLVATAAVLAAVLFGWLLGAMLDHPAPAPAAPAEQAAQAGAQRVQLDGSWQPAQAAKDTAALKLTGLTAFAPVPGLPGRVWIAQASVDGPSLLPASLRAQVVALSTPAKAKLAGLAAWHYPAMQLRRGGLLEVTTLATSAGVLLVGCQADETSWSTVAGCAAGIRSVSGTTAVAPDAALAFRARLAPVLTELNAARAGGAKALARARHARGQAAAAARLAAAHRAAAAALAPLAPATGPARAAVVRLSATAAAYAKLAGAAHQRNRRAYGRARARVAISDHKLRASLAAAAGS